MLMHDLQLADFRGNSFSSCELARGYCHENKVVSTRKNESLPDNENTEDVENCIEKDKSRKAIPRFGSGEKINETTEMDELS